jgi:hypothetical protein
MGFVSAEAAQERICAALEAIDAAHEVLRATSSDLVAASPGPTAKTHPILTTPTTPTNSSKATPTHQKTSD